MWGGDDQILPTDLANALTLDLPPSPSPQNLVLLPGSLF